MRALTIISLGCLLSLKLFSQAPAIVWSDNAPGNLGGTYVATTSGSSFFAAEVTSTTTSREIRVKKYDASGVTFNVSLFRDRCEACSTTSNLPLEIFPTSDGGAIVYYETTSGTPIFRKIIQNGNSTWSSTFNNLKFIKASPTGSNGIYLTFQVLSGSNANNYFVYNIDVNGVVNWTKNLSTILPKDLAATPDGGVVITDTDSTKRFDSTGKKLWAVKRGGNLVRVADSDFAYQADASRIMRISLSTGNIDFTRNQSTINDLLITTDKGIVFSTDTKIQKISTTNAEIWSTNVGSQRLTLAPNGIIGSVGTGANSNRLTAYNTNGNIQWQKTMTYNLGDKLFIHTAPDNGWYVTTRGQITAKPSSHGIGFLYRLASDNAPCNYTVNISPNTKQSICKTGEITFEVSQPNLDLSYGLPSTDYVIQWFRNNGITATNKLSYSSSQDGKYFARITQGSCISVSTEVDIDILGTTSPSITADFNELCAGGGSTVKLTSTGCLTNASVLWSDNQTGLSVNVSPNTTTDYSAKCVQVYTQNGSSKTCQSDAGNTQRVTVLTTSNLTIPNGITSASAICKGTTEQLSVQVAGNSLAPLTYTWTRNSATVSTQPTYTASQEGSYRVSIKDRRGCTALSVVKQLNLLGTVSPSITADFAELCAGGGASVKLTSTGCSTDASVLWSDNQTGLSVNASPNVTTDYSAKCVQTYTQSNGSSRTCPSDAGNTQRVTVLTASNLTVPNGITSASAICKGTTEQLSVQVAGNSLAPLTYVWTRNNATVSTQSTYTTSQEGSYRVSIKDKRGCTAQSPVKELNLLGTKTPTVSSNFSEICVNGGVSPVISATGCSSSATLWNTGANTPSIQVSPTVTTDYAARCVDTFVTANGSAKTCEGTQSPVTKLTVLQKSNIIITDLFAPNVFCKNDAQDTIRTEVKNFTNPLNFNWFRNGNLISKDLEIIVSDAGSYQLKVQDARGCTGESVVKKIDRSELEVSITGDRAFCAGTSTKLQATASKGIGSTTFEWQLEGRAISTNTNVTLLDPGNYVVKATDSKGCKEEVSIPVRLYPKIVAGYNRTATVKGNLFYNFDETKLLEGTRPFNVTLSALSENNVPVPIEQNKVGKFTKNSTIYIRVTDANSCSFRDSIKINYVPCNVAVSIAGDTSFCYYEKVTLRANQTVGVRPFTFTWSIANSQFPSENNSTLVTGAVGTYRTTMTDSAQCVVTSNPFTIKDKGRDIVAFIRANGDSVAYRPFGVDLSAPVQDRVTYQWFRNDTLIVNEVTPTLYANQTGKYKVRVSKDGCFNNSNEILITILTPLAVERYDFSNEVTAFPNPTDDRFIIKSRMLTPTAVTCRITSTQGKVLFEEKSGRISTENEWQVNASRWPAGVYIYHISSANGEASGKIIIR